MHLGGQFFTCHDPLPPPLKIIAVGGPQLATTIKLMEQDRLGPVSRLLLKTGLSTPVLKDRKRKGRGTLILGSYWSTLRTFYVAFIEKIYKNCKKATLIQLSHYQLSLELYTLYLRSHSIMVRASAS